MTAEPDARAACAFGLLHLPEMTTHRLGLLFDHFGGPEGAADAIARGVAGRPLGSALPGARALARQWASALDLDAARARLAQTGVRVLVVGDRGFPFDPALPDPPPVLLVAGAAADAFTGPAVAIVGTRAATPNGVDDAHSLARTLADEGVTVVSGMAIGIDGAAHAGALDGGGVTVGVVATGLDVEYPRRHQVLYRRVRERGLLVSEMPFGTHPHRSLFPIRNRIIAGVADAVVVVEATPRGGARITAEWALTYGRPVLAMPGSRRNLAARGCNELIADGAVPLLDPADVLTALDLAGAGRPRRGWGEKGRPAPEGDAAAVLGALGGEPATADQVASRTGLAPAAVAAAVAALERAGWVRRERGMVWPC